jgi:transketolase
MLRVIPNMTICAPADPYEAKLAARFMTSFDGPGYVRINKSGETAIHDLDSAIKFFPGEFIQVAYGEDIAVITIGAVLGTVLDEVKSKKYNWSIFSSPFIGGYSKEKLISLAQQYKYIVTVEEHQLNGGFGSSIIEVFSDLYNSKVIEKMPFVKRIGINNQFISVAGSQEYLREVGGLDIKVLFSKLNAR